MNKKETKEEVLKMFLTLCFGLMVMAAIFIILYNATLLNNPSEYYAYVATFGISAFLQVIGIIIGLKEGYDWL